MFFEKKNFSNDNKNKPKNRSKKLNKNVVKTIKSVINKLNNLITNCVTEQNEQKENMNYNIYKKNKNIYDYNSLLDNLNKYLIKKKNIKIKKAKNINKQIPLQKTFKKISISDIQKLHHIKENDKIMDSLNLKESTARPRNPRMIRDFIEPKKKIKSNIISHRQPTKFKQGFEKLVTYFKLHHLKRAFKNMIYYTTLKNQYILGFINFIAFVKKRPFIKLRIIQQTEYYQVILRQFYLPYLVRAFYNIKDYVICQQKFYNADYIIKQVYYIIFFKRLFFYIEMKENCENENYKKEKEEDNNDDIKYIENTFNKIFYNISISPKIYVFSLLKHIYEESKKRRKNIKNAVLFIPFNKYENNYRNSKNNLSDSINISSLSEEDGINKIEYFSDQIHRDEFKKYKQNKDININVKGTQEYNDRYSDYREEDIIQSDRIGLKINIPNEMKNQFIDNLANEIISNLLNDEIKNKKNILYHKSDTKIGRSSIASDNNNKESASVKSQSTKKKYLKTSSPHSIKNTSIESYPNLPLSSQDDENLNNSIFKRTIYQIKNEYDNNYYEVNIFPKILQIIGHSIDENYSSIIDNLKIPFMKDDKEIIQDLSYIVTYETINNNSVINYEPKFLNKEQIKKEFISKNILTDFNKNLEKECKLYHKFYFKYLNSCVLDSANEVISDKRLYGNIGEPLIWSNRARHLEYKYKNTQMYKELFIKDIINELKNNFFEKIGAFIENTENLNLSQFSKERDNKYNQSIKNELKKTNLYEKMDEQETIVKIIISKVLMYQLLNEVVEILEHVQNSRKFPEKYMYQSIFACDNIPILNFQKKNLEKNIDDEKCQDLINQ
jgi:hypothetical protein